ncbi:MAG: 16S rRNA (cytosine(1402)-N(4))-methyltransferase RsmH [Dinghuibacter sp.]|nr:16S rRNA (cytosine(1402)-N(4))-methyltransferase RsmH [Dinghuibacter sp.]
MQPYHIPVLLSETIEALRVEPEGVYVDCTFGGGGHSRALLERLGPGGRLFVFDQDEAARQNLPNDSRVTFIHQNFTHLKRMLKLNGITSVQGIMADLGVSSHQFDEAERGFSIRYDAPLDMRMDKRNALTAARVVMEYDERQLHLLFEKYGEVTNSKTLAATIVKARKTTPLLTTSTFKTVIGPVVKGNPNRYLAQVFQALRIEVNNELGVLEEMLVQTPGLLAPGGRIAIITFHSLEDRLVKRFFKTGSFNPADENPFIQSHEETPFRVITRKPVEPGEEEIKNNPRSRSARLRVAEKI